MAAKLTEIIKKEMLEGFSKGKSFACISKEYGCTPSTVTRAVKSFLTDEEFARLKSKRSKINPLRKEASNNSENQNDSIKTKPLGDLGDPTVLVEDKLKNIDKTELVDSVISNEAEAFTEIIPLGIEPFSDEQKEVACTPLDAGSLPNTVFMLITKNNELESKALKDFSDWSFLPEKDQNRLVIQLFSNHRDAKRTCSRNQKVLKVPNPSVFLISLSYLISKGITRLIIDESLISLDH